MTDKFDFKPETLKKKEDEERKGGGFLPGLLSRLGLGGAAGGGAEAGLGGGGLLASKAAVVALLLAGTTVAAGIGMLGSGSRGTARHVSGGSVFSSDKEGAIGSAAELSAEAPRASADGASSSLDYLASANAPAETPKDAAASGGETADASATAEDANAGSHAAAAGAAGSSPRAGAPRPQMVKSAGMPSTSGGGNTPRLDAQAGLAGSGFQNVYKAPPKGTSGMSAGSRARMGATRLSAIRPGGTAAKQLGQTSKVVKGNLRSGNVSSPGSGLTYDGGAGSVGSAGTAASGAGIGGTGTGGGGIDSSPGSQVSKDLREVQPPPEPVKDAEDKTPYKNTMYMAIGALLAGMVCLFAAGQFQKSGNFAAAQALGWIAAGLGVVAAGLGVVLLSQYGQTMQGGMFALSGAFLAYQGYKAATDATAAEQAQAKITAQNTALQNNCNTMLKPGGSMANVQGASSSGNVTGGEWMSQQQAAGTNVTWTQNGSSITGTAVNPANGATVDTFVLQQAPVSAAPGTLNAAQFSQLTAPPPTTASLGGVQATPVNATPVNATPVNAAPVQATPAVEPPIVEAPTTPQSTVQPGM
ncbi:MAG: hypothetical protein WC969_06865 [Elusimicrobiota bacterium]|jgi:hypothetical protein